MSTLAPTEARAGRLSKVYQTKNLADVRLTGPLRSDGARSRGSEVDSKGRPWERGEAHRKPLKPGQNPKAWFSLVSSQAQQRRAESPLCFLSLSGKLG